MVVINVENVVYKLEKFSVMVRRIRYEYLKDFVINFVINIILEIGVKGKGMRGFLS